MRSLCQKCAVASVGAGCASKRQSWVKTGFASSVPLSTRARLVLACAFRTWAQCPNCSTCGSNAKTGSCCAALPTEPTVLLAFNICARRAGHRGSGRPALAEQSRSSRRSSPLLETNGNSSSGWAPVKASPAAHVSSIERPASRVLIIEAPNFEAVNARQLWNWSRRQRQRLSTLQRDRENRCDGQTTGFLSFSVRGARTRADFDEPSSWTTSPLPGRKERGRMASTPLPRRRPSPLHARPSDPMRSSSRAIEAPPAPSPARSSTCRGRGPSTAR